MMGREKKKRHHGFHTKNNIIINIEDNQIENFGGMTRNSISWRLKNDDLRI
jgi:hypothetical protein